jgi:ABC-type transport system involved in cytochrome c biogenesis permease subunit
MELLLIIVLWLAFSVITAYVASERGRSVAGIFFLSVILSPLVGFLTVVALPAREKPKPEAFAATFKARKRCTNCEAWMLKAAIICPRCDAPQTQKTYPTDWGLLALCAIGLMVFIYLC